MGMRHRFVVALGVVVLLFGASHQVGASPKIAVHIVPGTTNNACGDPAPAGVPCSEIVRTQSLPLPDNDFTLYVIAEETDPGISGALFGIAYDPGYPGGLDAYGYCFFGNPGTYLSDGPFGPWPHPWSGARVTWADCQTGFVTGHEDEGMRTLIGAIWAHTPEPDVFSIIPHPETHKLWLINCQGLAIDLPDSAGGQAGFAHDGYNPCTGEGVWTPVPLAPPPPPLPPPPLRSPAAVLLHVTHETHPAEWCGMDFTGHDVVTAASLQPEDNPHVVYLLAVPEDAAGLDASGITGVQLGIQYPTRPEEHRGMKVLDWHTCSDVEFQGDNWPASGTSNTITWALGNCAMGDLVTVGYFTVSAYDPSAMSIIPFPPSGFIKVATCKGAEEIAEEHVDPARAGWVSFGGAAIGTDTDGCNPLLGPCGSPTPVQVTTWGKLKRLYR